MIFKQSYDFYATTPNNPGPNDGNSTTPSNPSINWEDLFDLSNVTIKFTGKAYYNGYTYKVQLDEYNNETYVEFHSSFDGYSLCMYTDGDTAYAKEYDDNVMTRRMEIAPYDVFQRSEAVIDLLFSEIEFEGIELVSANVYQSNQAIIYLNEDGHVSKVELECGLFEFSYWGMTTVKKP